MALIANPIYDSVFKFLMEDDRAAKVLLSALLKRKVNELKMRRNEYTNLQQTRISLFRIDFSAKLVNAAGKEQLVLIELQKTWLATETLRFRQYLGSQYLNKENIKEEDNPQGFGMPIISIYILGHKVGNLQLPVVYVRRHYLDYDDHEIEKGVPDPFIESLTHDSIIVQIPYLKENARNHLERILRIFDQNYRTDVDDHLLNINDEGMEKDELLLVKRLTLAAASPEIRRDMQVEDEILSEIEARDTEIMMKKKELELKSQEIKEKKKEIEQSKKEIEQSKKEIEQNKKEIEQKSQKIQQQSQEIEQQSQKIGQQERILYSTVQNLVVAGMEINQIAHILSISAEEVQKMLKENN